MTGDDARLPGLLPGERADALSVTALYGRVQAVLSRAFSRAQPLWVRGEIHSISDRTGHCYMDLIDPDAAGGRDSPVLKVNCWSRQWTPIKDGLERQGVRLEPGIVITLRGRVEIYPPRGQVNFIAADLDVTALLGQLAARRAALLRQLEVEGLLELNKALTVPEVPLLVGLVASRDTEGYRDFTGQLLGSRFAFRVVHARASVQGASAPRQIAAAVLALCEGQCDVVVVVRGGGSKADLAAFDSEGVARAIATAAAPVWTGIGHTGDRTVADIVANRAFVTPTECGRELVGRVEQWWGQVASRGDRLVRQVLRAMEASAAHDSHVRARLGSSARAQLDRHGERLVHRVARLAAAAPRCAAAARATLGDQSLRIERAVGRAVIREGDRLTSLRRLMVAYDVDRQLERGYTVSLTEDGQVLRSAAQLSPGGLLVSRFVDGTARSEVKSVDLREDGER